MQPKRYALIFDIKKGLKNNENIEFVTEDFGTNVIDIKIENEYGQNYDLSGTIPRLMVKTPSGVPYQRDMIPTNHIAGLCEINLPQEMFTEVGTHTAEIQIWDEATNIIRTTLKQFTYKVRASLQTPEAVEADNNFSLIQSVIANANTATERAISAAQKAEDIVIGEGVLMETEKGVPNGIATLDENGKIPSSQIPSGSGGGSSNATDVSYDNTVSELNAENVQDAIDELFQYASDGKIKIATAITGKGVPTSSSDSFTQMATNIDNIEAISTDDATATPGSILLNDTAYVKGTKLTGTMPDMGTINYSLPINGAFTIPAGKHSGSGKVTQSIPTKGAATIIPSTTDQVIAAGQYLSGIQTIAGDANLIAPNIKSGVDIFGTIGSLIGGTGAKKFASGTVISSADTREFAKNSSEEISMRYVKVTGLTFTPSIIEISQISGDWDHTIYSATRDFGSTKDLKIVASLRSGWGELYFRNVYPASVSATGFTLPTLSPNTQYTWKAWE